MENNKITINEKEYSLSWIIHELKFTPKIIKTTFFENK
jgi:hypothetical protein